MVIKISEIVERIWLLIKIVYIKNLSIALLEQLATLASNLSYFGKYWM